VDPVEPDVEGASLAIRRLTITFADGAGLGWLVSCRALAEECRGTERSASVWTFDTGGWRVVVAQWGRKSGGGMARIRRFGHDRFAVRRRPGGVVALAVALTFGAASAFAACSSGSGVTSESVAATDTSTVPTTEDVIVSTNMVPASTETSTTFDRSAADSYAAGYGDGYAAGYADGYLTGGDAIRSNLSLGGVHPAGADDSYWAGFDAGYDQGWSDGWDAGYDDALAAVDGTVSATFPPATFPPATFPPDTAPVSLTEYARITTWFTSAEADDSAWVHFKAVDGSGFTLQEVPGSEIMNLRDEAGGAERTTTRVELVDALRQMMIDDGWTETGVDGEWYEYTFGR
jgi:hypothetical protein